MFERVAIANLMILNYNISVVVYLGPFDSVASHLVFLKWF